MKHGEYGGGMKHGEYGSGGKRVEYGGERKYREAGSTDIRGESGSGQRTQLKTGSEWWKHGDNNMAPPPGDGGIGAGGRSGGEHEGPNGILTNEDWKPPVDTRSGSEFQPASPAQSQDQTPSSDSNR